MSCYQGNTPLQHSHNIVKISEFVMVNEVKGTPVEMTLFTSCLPYQCSIENNCTPQRGFITWVCLTIALEGRS